VDAQCPSKGWKVSLENESDVLLYAEFADLPLVVDKDLLNLDPGSFDFLEGLGGPGNTGLNGISKLLGDEALISVTRASDVGDSFL